MHKTNWILRAEGLLLLLVAVVLYGHDHFSFIWFAVFLLAPDLFMIGYLKNNKVGAFTYNLGHSMVLPFTLFIIAILSDTPSLLAASLIWLAHIGMDRFFGYGLKLDSSFKDTHLGKL